MKEMIGKIRAEREGFTLAELLVVVAIIAVLVAIAIPVFTASLAKAQAATDEANIRAGYAVVQSGAIDGRYDEKDVLGLNDDGSVTETAGNYTCKGDSAKLESGTSNIAGQSPVWAEGNGIVYTVGTDGKVTIAAS